jgi:hypothetical protein
MATALDTLSWTEIAKLPRASATDRSFLIRLKGDRLTQWDRLRRCVGCPHCPNLGTPGGTSTHLLWECPRANALWGNLQAKWEDLWSPERAPSRDESKRSVFSLQLETIPDQLWVNPELARLSEPTPETTIRVHAAIQEAWRLMVLATFHTLWKWKTHPDKMEEVWTTSQAVGYHDVTLSNALAKVRWPRLGNTAGAICPHSAAAMGILKDTVDSRTTQAQPVDGRASSRHQVPAPV